MAELSKGQPLRNSTGKLKEVAKGVDIGPNYLRASSGSCHDFCKYGTPHEFKAKPKRPVTRRSTPNSEITVEIFVPSDKRSAKALKPSSVVPNPSKSTKLEVAVSGKSPKSVRQQDSSSKKVRSSHVSGKIDPQTQLDVKSLSPDLSNSAKQESPSDVKSLSSDLSNSVKQESSVDVNFLSPDSSKSVIKQDSPLELKSLSPDSSNSVRQETSSISVKQESSLVVISESPDSSKSVKKEYSMDVLHDSSNSVKQESSSNSVKQESSLDVISESPDSSKSVKQESSFDVKPSPPDSSISAKHKSSSVVKSSPPDSSISVKQESSSDVKSSSYASLKKGSSSQRNSSNTSKSTLQDVQSRRKSSLCNVSGSARQSASKESKPVRSPRLMSGSISKASTVGRKSSLPNDKAPLKNDTSTNLGISLMSKSNRASTEQSSSPNLPVRKSGNGLGGKRNTESKIDNVSRTSKAASKKKMGSPPTTLSLNTRRNLETAVESSLTSSTTIALTPNLPGTKVARLNVRKNITQKEGSRNTEATSDELNGNSASKKPENHEKVPEKTLHMIEAASNQQSLGPGDDNGTDITQSQLQFSPGSIDSLCQSKSPFSSQDAVETNESESEYSESEADDSVSYSSKGRVLGHEGNGSGPVKLKFRRGKVVDLQSETDSPKRLRFRRRKSLGKDQCEADGVKVVLRHQDLQEKKSEKGLLNVVIEETASKLVETKKSKVMALVGAFETVISLQESKPAGEKLSPYSSPGR